MSDYYYNITKTENGILIHDRFFDHQWDGWRYTLRDGKVATTNLGNLKLERIQTSRIQIELDYDPDDVYFIIEDIIFNLDGDFYYYRDWAEISRLYHALCLEKGYKISPLPNIQMGGFIENTDNFELLPCELRYDEPVFITD